MLHESCIIHSYSQRFVHEEQVEIFKMIIDSKQKEPGKHDKIIKKS